MWLKQSTVSGSSIKPIFPASAQNVSGFEIEEQLAGGL
jgi:hypothetical protein